MNRSLCWEFGSIFSCRLASYSFRHAMYIYFPHIPSLQLLWGQQLPVFSRQVHEIPDKLPMPQQLRNTPNASNTRGKPTNPDATRDLKPPFLVSLDALIFAVGCGDGNNRTSYHSNAVRWTTTWSPVVLSFRRPRKVSSKQQGVFLRFSSAFSVRYY